MPAEHKIDDDNRIIQTVWSGEATDTELLDALFKYQRDVKGSRHECYDEILDFSAVTGINLSTAGIKRIAHMAVGSDVPGVKTKIAIIVTRPIAYGLARMYATYRSLSSGSTKEVRVYKKQDDALKWIGERKAC